MYTNDIRLNASIYQNVFRGSTGRLYVPVKRNVALYAQFDHVRGTPAQQGQRGVPVDRIRILNTLIDQLVSMKKKPEVSKDDAMELSDSQKDALIQTYQQEIKSAIASASMQGGYGLAGIMPEPGTMFSISA